MIITRQGKDIIELNNIDWDNDYFPVKEKVHLIKMSFADPTEEKIFWVLKKYEKTNRYVVEDNISFYNRIFKHNLKKFYVENKDGNNIFSFFKKNNKILLNFNRLNEDDLNFMTKPNVFADILQNLEIIKINSAIFEKTKNFLVKWNGNIIIQEM